MKTKKLQPKNTKMFQSDTETPVSIGEINLDFNFNKFKFAQDKNTHIVQIIGTDKPKPTSLDSLW